MTTKQQLQRELIKAHARIRELEDKLKDVSNSWKSSDELVSWQRKIIEQQRNENHDLLDRARTAEDVAEKLFHVNDVLCAELQDCDRCIDTVRMALDQKSTRAELLNRITGPLV